MSQVAPAGERPVGARRPLGSRLSAGHAVMLLAGLTGALLTLGLLHDAERTEPVLVAARDLVPGRRLQDDDLRPAEIHAGGRTLDALVRPAERDEVVGGVLATRVERGALLRRTDVEAPSSSGATRSMGFPLPRARALGGEVDVGERVDILGVTSRTGAAAYVVTGAEVLDVDRGSAAPLGTSDDVVLTVEVDARGALRLAAALETGTVTLVRATGAAPIVAASSDREIGGSR